MPKCKYCGHTIDTEPLSTDLTAFEAFDDLANRDEGTAYIRRDYWDHRVSIVVHKGMFHLVCEGDPDCYGFGQLDLTVDDWKADDWELWETPTNA